MDLTRDKSTTVIITTHYIEEARRADAVSLKFNKSRKKKFLNFQNK